jgi:hypothetical protein
MLRDFTYPYLGHVRSGNMKSEPKNLFRNTSRKAVKVVTQEVFILIYWHDLKNLTIEKH